MIKIVLTGPESTGKTILAKQLAQHYQTFWVPEYARFYLTVYGAQYQEQDLLKIAKGQKVWEDIYLKHAKEFLFCDTAMLVMKIWSEVKYDRCHSWIENQIQKGDYQNYLLCDIDLPWSYDPLRESQNHLKELFDRYKSNLDELGANYRIVRGQGQKRLDNAMKAVEELKTLQS